MIELKNITVEFTPNTKILKNITASFPSGQLHAIVGPNGSGKTSLIKTMSGILRPLNDGRIFINKSDLASLSLQSRAAILAYVESQHASSFSYSVSDIISWGRWVHHRGKPTEQDFKAVKSAAKTMGIEHLIDRSVTQLSTGERKKIMLAQSLASEAAYLLWDEPLAPLDLNSAARVVATMKQLASAGSTFITSFHDVALALRCADTISIVQDGQLAWTGNTADIAAREAVEAIFGVKTQSGGIYFT